MISDYIIYFTNKLDHYGITATVDHNVIKCEIDGMVCEINIFEDTVEVYIRTATVSHFYSFDSIFEAGQKLSKLINNSSILK